MKSIAFAGFFALLALGDKAQRLVCYDSAVVRVPGALNTNRAPDSPPLVTASAVPPPAPVVAARKKHGSSFMDRLFGAGTKRAPQTTIAQFGSASIASAGREASPIAMDADTIDQIGARLVAYVFSDGYVIVTLDNGQVWRQTADGKPLQSLSRPALAYSAVISRGGSGSYDMNLSGLARTIAVRRIR